MGKKVQVESVLNKLPEGHSPGYTKACCGAMWPCFLSYNLIVKEQEQVLAGRQLLFCPSYQGSSVQLFILFNWTGSRLQHLGILRLEA